MQITSRFTIAVHTLVAIEYFKEMDRVNSEFLAGSTGVNPVIIRTVISRLREAGILKTQRGSSGAELLKPLSEITFYDIYKAVDSVDEEEGLFHFHEQPNPDCPVGGNIHRALDGKLDDIQLVMEERMKQITVQDVADDVLTAVKEKAALQAADLTAPENAVIAISSVSPETVLWFDAENAKAIVSHTDALIVKGSEMVTTGGETVAKAL